MRKLFFLTLLFIITVISAYSTGIESAVFEIIPIAVHENGNILFKTRIAIDPQDAGAAGLYKYGFLVINDYGLWEEYYYYTEETEDSAAVVWERISWIHEKYEENDFNHIKKYKEIIAEYNFVNTWWAFVLDEEKANLIDYDERFLKRGYNENLKVKTLDRHSTYLDSAEVLLYYKFGNIYLIRNRRDFFSLESTGAEFVLPNYRIADEPDVRNLGYAMNIDGIVICGE